MRQRPRPPLPPNSQVTSAPPPQLRPSPSVLQQTPKALPLSQVPKALPLSQVPSTASTGALQTLEAGLSPASAPLLHAPTPPAPTQSGPVHKEPASVVSGTLILPEGVDDLDLAAAGAGESQDVSPQRPKGQLTSEERVAYRELQFVEHLGSGEFGKVFRGFCQGKEVAIKQLYWDNTVHPAVIIQELTKEIESFRHLRHKRLVSFVGACLEVPNLCLITEYFPGGSLHHLLHIRKMQLPQLHGTNMCLQLAEGVTYLHSQVPVVVHRDLKSLNVVLDLNLNLKLCDFGLTESMERTHITKKNNGGSPRYMAPELFDSKMRITEKVDVWAMGCIFSEIYGGPLPYEGINTLADLTREMLINRRTPVIPPKIADALQAIVRSCFNFDARLRPSARQVFDQLKDAKKRLRAQGIL